MWKLLLSDGAQTVGGFEYKKVHGFVKGKVVPGLKILVENVTVRRGLLMLTQENTRVISGSTMPPSEERDGDVAMEAVVQRGRGVGAGVGPAEGVQVGGCVC